MFIGIANNVYEMFHAVMMKLLDVFSTDACQLWLLSVMCAYTIVYPDAEKK